MTIRVFVLGVMLICSGAIQAETYATLFTHSYHFKRPTLYNENNWGLGFEHTLTDSWRAAAGIYRNSTRHDTVYVGGIYAPIRDYGFRVGAVLGLATGYNHSVVPLFFPTLSYEYRDVGVNIILVPSSVVGLQLKWKFD